MNNIDSCCFSSLLHTSEELLSFGACLRVSPYSFSICCIIHHATLTWILFLLWLYYSFLLKLWRIICNLLVLHYFINNDVNVSRLELHLEWKLITRCLNTSIMNILVQIILFMLPLVTWKTKIHARYLKKYVIIYLKISQSFSMHLVFSFKRDHLALIDLPEVRTAATFFLFAEYVSSFPFPSCIYQGKYHIFISVFTLLHTYAFMSILGIGHFTLKSVNPF